MSQKNYITPNGAERLKSELRHLRDKERPEVVRVVAWAASNGDRSENADYIYGKRRLREIDRRIEHLTDRLSRVEIVDPLKLSGEKIFFGATVTIENSEGNQKRLTIVGEDETDAAKNYISWTSPMGKALLNKSEGDSFWLKTPAAEEEFEIIEVKYVEIL